MRRKVSFICDCDVKQSHQSIASLSSFSAEAVGRNILVDRLLCRTLWDGPQLDQGLSNWFSTTTVRVRHEDLVICDPGPQN